MNAAAENVVDTYGINTRHPAMLLTTLAVASCCACSAPPLIAPAANTATGDDQLVSKVWVAADGSAAPGTFRVFLPNGTLVMDSCWETYRLVTWRRVDDRRIEWTEDTARIEAQVAELTSDRLRLTLQLTNEVREETYRLAQVPTVCPDMPR